MLETAVSTALADDEAMIREFILEANEHLASIENGMLALEQDAGGETMHAIFPGVHGDSDVDA